MSFSSDRRAWPLEAATNSKNMGCQGLLIKRHILVETTSMVSTIMNDATLDAALMNSTAKMDETEVLRVKLEVLRREHRDLDEAISALQERASADMLTIRRLKKQKLALKDRISVLEDRILPDIIA